MKNGFKLLILIAIVFVAGYFAKASDEALSGYDIESVSGTIYKTEEAEKILIFNADDSGIYITEKTTQLFSYTIKNGKIEALYSDDEEATFYIVKSGLFYQNKNLYFYLNSK